MIARAPSSETVHASCVAIGGRGVLLAGRSGAGKSDLALRLIDRGAALVSDDYTLVRNAGGRLIGSAPAAIAGRIEVRGIGIVPMGHLAEAPLALLVVLDEAVERMPAEPLERRAIAGGTLPVIALAGLESTAPIKVELALRAGGAQP